MKKRILALTLGLLLLAQQVQAAVSVAVQNFVWLQADVVGTNHDVACGFPPVFSILFNGGPTSLTDGTSTSSNSRAAVGFVVSNTNRRSLNYSSADNAAAAGTTSRHNAASAMVPNGTIAGLLDVLATGSWTDANTPRYQVTTQLTSGGNYALTHICVGGSTVTAAATGQFQVPTSAATDTTISPGFTPAGACFASIGNATAPNSGVTDGVFMFGCTDGTRSWVHYMASDDGADPTATRGYMKSAECVALGPPADGITLDLRGSCAFSGSDIVIDYSEVNGTAQPYIFWLAWACSETCFRVDNTASATDTNQFTKSGLSITPTGVMVVSADRAESTADTPTAPSQWSVGAGISSTSRAAQASNDEDALATTETSVCGEFDHIYCRLSATTHALVGTGDLVSFGAGEITFVMTDADPDAAFWGLAIWGTVAAGGATPRRSVIMVQ